VMFQHYIYTHAHPTHVHTHTVVYKYTHFKACNSFVSLPLLHTYTHHTHTCSTQLCICTHLQHTHMHTYTPHIHTHTPPHTQNASKVARKQYCPGLCNNKSLIFNLVVLLCYTLRTDNDNRILASCLFWRKYNRLGLEYLIIDSA